MLGLKLNHVIKGATGNLVSKLDRHWFSDDKWVKIQYLVWICHLLNVGNFGRVSICEKENYRTFIEILKDGVDPDVSEAMFKKVLKSVIK